MSLLIFAGHAFSQNPAIRPKPVEAAANAKADSLKSELSLNDEQHSKVRAAVLEKQNQTRSIHEKYRDSANKKGMNKELKAVNEQFRSTMKGILTPEQSKKFEAREKKNQKAAKNKAKPAKKSKAKENKKNRKGKAD